ncbi:MAG TPA: hypothetical protein PLT79_03760 [Flavobacterium sp.]|jgi:hypothetical protein|nr:hypothetical protein [Flavobacterium sp.]
MKLNYDINIINSEIQKINLKTISKEGFCKKYYISILRKILNDSILNNIDSYKKLFESINIDSDNNCSDTSYPNYYKHRRFIDQSSPSTNSPKGYFKVWFKTDFDYESIIKIINSEYDSRLLNKFEQTSKNVIFVSTVDLDRFLNKYQECVGIYFSEISKECNINWTNELIANYKKVWDWKYIQSNPSVKFNFALIDENYDKVDWSLMSCHKDLRWDINKIEKWENYLIFPINYKYNDQWTKNKHGQSYPYRPKTNGSISSSTNVDWSAELLEKFCNLLDWSELSGNESIIWTLEMIDKFKEFIVFKILSSNKNVVWSLELIEKYKDHWDWDSLSGNPNIPWSHSFLNKYNDLLRWIPKYNSYKGEECISEPSISTNPGINWTIELIDSFSDKLDFWNIARVGKINSEIAIKYKNEFDRKEHIGFIFHKSSDNRETEYIYVNGWQNLTKNSNFYIDNNSILFYYENIVTISFSTGNLASNSCTGALVTCDFKILEILKDQVISLTFQDLINNELSWTKILINDNFMNNSIWENIIKPYLEEIGIDIFLSDLQNELNQYNVLKT